MVYAALCYSRICNLDSTYRFFLADATGHGVQATLITKAIKGIYDSINHEAHDSRKVLEIFNNEFIEKYIFTNSYVTTILIDVDVRDKN